MKLFFRGQISIESEGVVGSMDVIGLDIRGIESEHLESGFLRDGRDVPK